MRDHVDYIARRWAHERPDVDFWPFEVVGRVMRLAQIFEAAESRLLAARGLNRTEYGILTALRRTGPAYALSPAELGAAVILTSGAMTKRLDKLEAAGLVERKPSTRDRRALVVEITDRGKALVEELLERDLAQERTLVAALSAEEQKEFAALARTLLLSLDTTVLDVIERRSERDGARAD